MEKMGEVEKSWNGIRVCKDNDRSAGGLQTHKGERDGK